MRTFCLLILFGGLISQTAKSQDSIPLQQKAAQMLIVGFRGTELKPDNPIYNDITNLKIGGVILFDYDTPTKTRPRNIKSAAQVRKLNKDLQTLANGSLFISIDQEGGYVNRLKTRNGFPLTRTARYLGRVNNADTTKYWAARIAETLASLGFNLNFAPDTDVNINPKSPAIGKVQRSFSSNPHTVAKHAQIWIDEQSKQHIISSVKHFPGHGSAKADTHLGMVDVTNTWTEKELIPFQMLIDSGKVDMVMTSHIINRHLDSLPATLSYNILTGILRNKMGYGGIIVSDDIAMGAIADHYTLDDAVEKAINAGVDMIILSNNGTTFNGEITSKVINIICKLVEEGKISRQTINNTYNRIISLKCKYGLIAP